MTQVYSEGIEEPVSRLPNTLSHFRFLRIATVIVMGVSQTITTTMAIRIIVIEALLSALEKRSFGLIGTGRRYVPRAGWLPLAAISIHLEKLHTI